MQVNEVRSRFPSRDFRATSLFYAKPGFVETWRDDDWMILERGDLLPGRTGRSGMPEEARLAH